MELSYQTKLGFKMVFESFTRLSAKNYQVLGVNYEFSVYMYRSAVYCCNRLLQVEVSV
jgi:hypothetical protein